jgi:hypothetical protein
VLGGGEPFERRVEVIAELQLLHVITLRATAIGAIAGRAEIYNA